MSAIARGVIKAKPDVGEALDKIVGGLNYETQASDKTSAGCNTKSTARAS
jgi:hypothetical protein